MPRRELRATMKLQSETETQRNILKGEMNMLFQTESGQTVGPIGQGTWYLGEDPDRFDAECSALRAGVEAGMNLIDTAEMYGDGAAEELVGRAIQGLDRDKLFLVSKVYPFNAGRGDIRVSCEDSLMRMKTDHLDLYLLHWRGSVPLAETVECMEELKEDGLIRAWGVSNLDTDDMQELFAQPDGTHCAANQVLYNVGSRGIEYDLLPLMRQHQIPVMAYCPLAQAGRLRPAEPPGPAADRWGASCHGASDPAGFPAGPAGGPADPPDGQRTACTAERGRSGDPPVGRRACTAGRCVPQAETQDPAGDRLIRRFKN